MNVRARGESAELLAMAADALVALLQRDEKKSCDFCDKIQWGTQYHSEKCPFGMAFTVLSEPGLENWKERAFKKDE